MYIGIDGRYPAPQIVYLNIEIFTFFDLENLANMLKVPKNGLLIPELFIDSNQILHARLFRE